MKQFAAVAARRAREEGGFTLVEVLVAIVVLAIGLGAVFQMLDVASHATLINRVRQAETSVGRELTEDTRSLAYTQLTPSGIASALQPLVPGSTASGSTLTVMRTANTSNGTVFTFTASFSACSLDDPSDGYGDHSQAPASGGAWCSDVAASGTTDTTPDDYKRVSVTLTPTGSVTSPSVQQTVLIYARDAHGPAVTCLSVNTTCPGTNQNLSTGTSQTFNVTTTIQAAQVKWLVNGSLPTSAQIPTGSEDPYAPTGNPSQFTWSFPNADGTYAISALGYDSNGHSGTTSSLLITLNRHMVIPPASVNAGWNQQINGVDGLWVPSVDQDVLYYRLYHQYGTNAATVVGGCSQVSAKPGSAAGLTCTDASAPSPGVEPTCTATNTANGYVGQSFTTPNYYWVVGVDTDPTTGQPRESTNLSTKIDANLCDHPPNAPTGLRATLTNGQVALSWTAPSPGDPDPQDSIQYWRIYRWQSGSASFPGSRLDMIGTLDASGAQVTSYIDGSPDPGGVAQSYCITAVDTHMNESTCSPAVVQ
jgi:prepilin-type N-terminal cleavage/methylation domain-containing protein